MNHDNRHFLIGSGSLGKLISSFDWSKTSLGPIDAWPQSLKTSVSIILNSQHPMWIGWGPEMTFLYNDAYVQVLSSSKHPWALGRPASEVWKEIWDICGPLADKVFQKGEATFVDNVRLFMNRGDHLEETYYSFSYSPIRDESGNVGGLFCPSAETTDKMLSERRLRTLGELSANALNEMTEEAACASAARTLAKNPDDVPFALLYLISSDQNHAFLQEAVGIGRKIAGVSPEVLPLGSASDAASSPWPLNQVIKSGRATVISLGQNDSLPLGPADQPLAHGLVAPVMSSSQERPIGVLIAGVNPCRKLNAEHLTFFDLISAQVARAIQNSRALEEERKRAEALAEIDRAKTTFFSNVSHEFRTPLTLMLGPLEESLADMQSPLSGKQRERQELTYRNALRLLKLVNSLLDFSRIESGRIQALYRPTDLSKVTTDLASVFRSAIEKAGLKLIVETQEIGEPVYIDREMWEKIVLNLLSNAFKFTLQGEIRVSLLRDGDLVKLRVEDTGTGIPKSEQSRVFERFHRIEGSRGRTYEGSGIGLALVQELVKLHGGSIALESEPDRGSAFTITLPLGTAHLPADRVSDENTPRTAGAFSAAFAEEASRWIPKSNLSVDDEQEASKHYLENRPRILLADDNADMREYVRSLLTQNWDVEAVADGEEALQAAKAHPPDLILTDVMMPKLNGFQLLQELRSELATKDIPVILLSARAGEEATIEGLQAGADDYLVKPFAAKELLARVNTHLQIGQLRSQAQTQREMMYSVFMQAPLAICVLDGPDHVFALANEGYYRLMSRQPNLLGKTVREAFPEIEGQGYFELLDRVYQTGEPHIANESPFKLCLPDGTLQDRYLDFVCHPKRDLNGQVDGVIAVVHDVTEQVIARRNVEKLASELKSAIASRDEFMSIASHELKTPITSLKLQLQMTRRRLPHFLVAHPDFDRISKAIETSCRQADRLTGLVEDLLDVSRIQAGKLIFNFEELDVSQLIHDVVARYIDELESVNCALELAVDSPLIATWDHGRIEQVIVNLLSNAIKYAPGCPITIRASSDDQVARILIRDQGPGIPTERQARIFERFERATSSRNISGLGLGLYIVNQIIKGHGGTIRVESGEGRGAAFLIELPLRPSIS